MDYLNNSFLSWLVAGCLLRRRNGLALVVAAASASSAASDHSDLMRRAVSHAFGDESIAPDARCYGPSFIFPAIGRGDLQCTQGVISYSV
jgi:hypothetical protein